MQLSAQQLSGVLLALRAAAEPYGQEGRRFTRLDVQTAVSVATLADNRVVRPFSALTRDISAQGIGLLQCMSLEYRQQVLLCLPCHKEMLYLLARIAFCRPLAEELFGVGAIFEAPAPHDLIEQFAQAQKEQLKRIRASILS